MKKQLLTCLSMAAFCVSAQAASISISFAGDNAGGTSIQINPGQTAGVVPDSDWNAATGGSGGPTALTNAGGATGATVTWSSANTWGGTGASNDAEAMANGMLDDGGGGSNVSIVGIPYANYDVYVYGSSDNGNEGRGFVTNVNGTDYLSGGVFTTLSANGTFFDGTNYVDGSTAAADPTYHLISGVSGPNLTVIGARTNLIGAGGLDYRGTIAGIQIVEAIPEPSSMVLMLSGLIGLVGFRRR